MLTYADVCVPFTAGCELRHPASAFFPSSQHGQAFGLAFFALCRLRAHILGYELVSMRKHTSAYVSLRQHTYQLGYELGA
jgi:hypothetical protein